MQVGLKLEAIKGKPRPSLGLETEADGSLRVVSAIDFDGTAYKAGIMIGDILLAIDEERVVHQTIVSRLSTMQIGAQVDVMVIRDDRILTIPLTLEAHQPTEYRIVEDSEATPDAIAVRNAWLKPYVAPYK